MMAAPARREARLDDGAWIRGDGTPIPSGRTLEDLVLAASGRRALPVVRERARRICLSALRSRAEARSPERAAR